MKVRAPYHLSIAIVAFAFFLSTSRLAAQDAHFHNAPVSSAGKKNPFAGQPDAVAAGSKLYPIYCAACHGPNGQGTGNIPPVSQGPSQTAPDGEVFWFITTGSVSNGMPAWGSLSEQQRWQIISFLKSLKNSADGRNIAAVPPAGTPVKTNAPLPQPPFTDFRFEQPGQVRTIKAQALPPPYATDTSNNGPKLVARPENVWPKAPNGFTVQLYATGLDNPR